MQDDEDVNSKPANLGDMKPIYLDKTGPNPGHPPQTNGGGNYETDSYGIYDANSYGTYDNVNSYDTTNSYDTYNAANSYDNTYDTYNPEPPKERFGSFSETANAPKSRYTPVETDWRQAVREDMAKTEQGRAELDHKTQLAMNMAKMEGRAEPEDDKTRILLDLTLSRKHRRTMRKLDTYGGDTDFEDAHDKNLLYTVSAILTLAAVRNIIYFFLTSALIGTLVGVINAKLGLNINIGVYMFFTFLGRVWALFVGLFGLMNYDNPKHLKKIFWYGIIMFAFAFISFVSYISMKVDLIDLLFEGITPLLMSGLIIYGAMQNIKEFGEE